MQLLNLKAFRIGSARSLCGEMLCIVVLCSGCVSNQYSVYHDGKPLNSALPEFSHPVVAFAPASIYDQTAQNVPSFKECDPVTHPRKDLFTKNKVRVTDSYSILAEWCQTMAINQSPYHFCYLNRKAFCHDSIFGAVCVGALSLMTIPYPAFLDYRWELRPFYLTGQEALLNQLHDSAKPRSYSASGEMWFTVFSPVALLVPRYRNHKKISLEPIEYLMSSKAHSEFKVAFIFDALNELYPIFESQTPERASALAFEQLIQTVFNQSYDPDKSYRISVNYMVWPWHANGQGHADVFASGHILRMTGDGEEQTLVMRPGHLYLECKNYSVTIVDDYGKNSLTQTSKSRTMDLGRIRNLAPVLSAWHQENVMRSSLKTR